MTKKWIQKAAKKNKGKFTRKAKKAGMTTRQYERHVLRKGSRASQTTKREARLAHKLGTYHKK